MHLNKEMLEADQFTTTPPKGCEFKVGDIVRFTNEYGVSFEPCEVYGFALPDDYMHKTYGNCVYLKKEAYWFANHPDSLTLLERPDAA